MCGIGGFYGMFDAALLGEINRTIAYRGPDDDGVWFDPDNRVGLCHRRLAILDLSSQGAQPMWDATRRAVIAFNGEIYNFKELRAELISEGYLFNSNTDTEVLLNLYLRYDVEMLNRINGMFAFAIWDARDRVLFVARDSMGIKPLYFSSSSDGFIFSSELKSILLDERISRSLNAKAIVDYLTLLYAPGDETMLGAVSKLLPGHAILLKNHAIVRHWCWQDLPICAEKVNYDADSAAVAIREKLEAAVSRQMIADVPVGAFLSGGLDSSSIVALATNYIDPGKLSCFTIAFKGKEWDSEGVTEDLPYAKEVAKKFGLDLQVVDAGPEIVDSLYQMVFHLDEPQADPAALHVRTICRLARNSGIKVLLSGTGGDDLFSGYRRHDALMAERYWGWLPLWSREVLAISAREAILSTPLKRRLSKVFSFADGDENQRLANYFNWIDPLSRNYLISSSMRQRLQALPNWPLLDKINQLPEGMSRLSKMLYLEQKYFLVDHNLNYTDKMSMAESVEVRVPFLDPEVVNFSWSLPDELKYRRGQGKWLLKKAMEPILPNSVIYRPKTGFGAPLRRWLHNELKEVVMEHLSDQSIRSRGLFDASGVRRLITLDRKGKVDGAYTIFSLLCIEIWCRLFIDGEWRNYTK